MTPVATWRPPTWLANFVFFFKHLAPKVYYSFSTESLLHTAPNNRYTCAILVLIASFWPLIGIAIDSINSFIFVNNLTAKYYIRTLLLLKNATRKLCILLHNHSVYPTKLHGSAHRIFRNLAYVNIFSVFCMYKSKEMSGATLWHLC